ncbi:hypothetical protein [Cellulosimicrobium arenosum]|uniref:Uncharacterized protein n=1 Tax=Cellulosimicrobium arenosum TaxID=2708133 RepID=A0A927G8M2_9MICO|nr:hypothetical protein [Cellulosimicrobium arenosum]MBD8078447.1 hypothetical protein [Cellulosimicrobium arenosum]
MSAGVRWSRRVLLVGGAALIGFGLWTAWSTVPSSQWPSALVWLAGGVVVHDAVLAPLAVAVGAWVLPRVPPVWRGPLRGGLLAAGTLGVLAIALVAGAADRRNPSVVPQDPLAAIAAAAIAVVIGAVVGAFLAGARPRGGDPDADRATSVSRARRSAGPRR